MGKNYFKGRDRINFRKDAGWGRHIIQLYSVQHIVYIVYNYPQNLGLEGTWTKQV